MCLNDVCVAVSKKELLLSIPLGFIKIPIIVNTGAVSRKKDRPNSIKITKSLYAVQLFNKIA